MKQLVIGVDLGGTNTRLGLVDLSSQILARARFRTRPELGPAQSMEILAQAIRRLKGQREILGVGIGVAGLLDHNKGILHIPPNLPGWEGAPIKAMLSAMLDTRVEVLNDVNALALGELYFGVAKGYKDVLCITLGTGVGGAIIANGKLLLGANQVAGELGHTVVKPNGPRCRCGQHGCLESLVGSARIVRLVQQGLRRSPDQGKQILKLAHYDPDRITPKLVARAARLGDPLATQILRQVGSWIGLALVNAVHLLDPELIVIGGGIARAGPILIKAIRETVGDRLLKFPGRRLEIKLSRLGDDAAILGAASLLYHR
jgi:glucokinase